MGNCIRDEKGRFTRHELDMTFLEAVSKDADYRTCKKCGVRRVVTGLMKLAAKIPPNVGVCDIAPVMTEKNEILSDAIFVEG